MSRYFFALWPDNPTRDRLQEVCNALPAGTGRIVARQNLHITLAFLGSRELQIVEKLCECAAAIEGTQFSLQLDQTGWWRKPQVVWVTAVQTPRALLDLVGKINSLIQQYGIRPDSRPYQPHLTIARKAARKPGEIEFTPIVWQINSFCLVQSDTRPQGAVYEIIETWPLYSG